MAPKADPIDTLTAGVDAYLAALPANEFDALVARVRDPEDNAGRDWARQLFNKEK